MPLESRNAQIDFGLVNQMTGFKPDEIHPVDILKVAAQLTPAYLHQERTVAQALESQFISIEADGIFKLLDDKKLPHPSAYGIYTVGVNPPENAILIGNYEKYPFEGFPATAIAGHVGDVYAVPIEDPSQEEKRIMLAFKGRAHPNEWVGERFAPMVVAHPLRVVKEMIRRQRPYEMINPPIILTYVTGVTEGYQMKPGQLGVVIDDTELASVLHPGYGPRDYLDSLDGEHFQPKAGRATDTELGKLFAETAKSKGIETFPVAVCGTPGMTEYQSFTEVPIFTAAFETALKQKGLKELARDIYGFSGDLKLAPLWDMGITFELATMRQTKKRDATEEEYMPNKPYTLHETPFSVLAVTLTTDVVGGEESQSVDHDLVVQRALATAPRNSELMQEFVVAATNPRLTNMTMIEDWSIRKALAEARTSSQ